MRRIVLVGALALVGIAGWWGLDGAVRPWTATQAAASASMPPSGDLAGAGAPRAHDGFRAVPGPMPQRAAGGFAVAPDRGDLIAYPARPQVLHDGAYTWHRAGLSEAHALAAIASGRLRVTTPSGETLSFHYQRSVEHDSGDWTWIGRIDGEAGKQAIVTFGARAVFGVIDQPGKPSLKLTMRDGASWMVETDPVRLALTGQEATVHADDFKIPHAAAPAYGQAPAVAAGATAATDKAAAAADSGGALVDVLIGYSNGFAAGLGGQSQAVTRLSNLVDITNQAYANSQVAARLRLVATVQVNYPDNTDNDSTLDALSGVNGSTIDPAFNALRAAREQYGADMVSFVRKYDRLAQDGCGVAWIIGGSQQPYTARSAGSAYSVVSDGREVVGSTSYFCREETFAHELGHNLGAQHDRATASSGGSLRYGAFAYSFGYKTDAGNGNFYDIMAYGDSGQTAYRVFSNPRVTFCGGRACGLDNSADVARTFDQTAPVAATFRATVIPENGPRYPALVDARRQDIDGDGRDDLLWSLDGRPDWAYWVMNGGDKTRGAGFVADKLFGVLATGDFNGDGKLDSIWTDGVQLQMWTGNGTGFVKTAMRSYPSGYRVVAVGDVDGDGRADLVWRDDSDVAIGVWLMNGATVAGGLSASSHPAWWVLGSADLDGNGRLDLVWTNGSQMQVWLGQSNNTFAGAMMPGYPPGWTLFGLRDVDGDRRADLLWRYAPTGDVALWRMNGGSHIGSQGFAASPAWRPIGVGDFNGDGRGDIVWTDGQSMQLWVWGGAGFAGLNMLGYPGGWSLIQR